MRSRSPWLKSKSGCNMRHVAWQENKACLHALRLFNERKKRTVKDARLVAHLMSVIFDDTHLLQIQSSLSH